MAFLYKQLYPAYPLLFFVLITQKVFRTLQIYEYELFLLDGIAHNLKMRNS